MAFTHIKHRDVSKYRVRKRLGRWVVHAPGYETRTLFVAYTHADALRMATVYAERQAKR